MTDEEFLDFLLFHGYAVIQFRQIIAKFFRHDRPCHFICCNFALGQSFHIHLSVFVSIIVDTAFDEKSQCHDAQGKNGC